MQAVRDRIELISEETNTFRCVFWFMPDQSLRLLTHIKPSILETPFLRAAKLYIHQRSLLEPDEWIDLPSLKEYYITWERLLATSPHHRERLPPLQRLPLTLWNL